MKRQISADIQANMAKFEEILDELVGWKEPNATIKDLREVLDYYLVHNNDTDSNLRRHYYYSFLNVIDFLEALDALSKNGGDHVS